MKSDVNEGLVKKLIEDGDRKMEDSKEAVFSSPESLVEDAIRLYKKAKEMDPNNKSIPEKLKNAEASMEAKPHFNTPNKRP